MSPIIDISNDADAAGASLLDDTNGSGSKSILFFWADWHQPSNTGGPFDTVVKTLAQQNDGSVKFYRVLAEEAPKLSQKVCRICVVWLPYCIFTICVYFADISFLHHIFFITTTAQCNHSAHLFIHECGWQYPRSN